MSFHKDAPSSGRDLSPSEPFSHGEEFLSPRQAADYLHVSKSYLDKLRVYGGSPRFLRFGRKIRYRKSELNLWAEERCFSSTSDYAARAKQ